MLPTLAIVGRPNVGKSTLFNALTQTREALVADAPGLTRDRKFGKVQFENSHYWLIDTGGLSSESEAILNLITQQVVLALQEADGILFLVDGREGLTVEDENIAQRLRPFNKQIILVINKTEGLSGELIAADFHRLGFETVHTISAAHRRGLAQLMETVLELFPEEKTEVDTTSLETVEEGIKVAIVGRPNVGKSTLVNRMLGYERVVVFDQPGTTRDSIAIPFERDGQRYTLIDTAGIRRRPRVFEVIEKFSVIKSLQAIELAHIVIVVLDAKEGMTDQDANLLGEVLNLGRGLVIAVNKWDGLSAAHREEVRYHLERKLHFIDFAEIHFISALHGSGVGNLFESIQTSWQAAQRQVNTSVLNEVLQKAVAACQPPLVKGRRVKLRYIHQGGHNPPVFVIHGNQVAALPDSYKRYLINTLRKELELEGTPIQLVFRQGENPFEGRKNELTLRQRKKRQRLMRHVKK